MVVTEAFLLHLLHLAGMVGTVPSMATGSRGKATFFDPSDFRPLLRYHERSTGTRGGRSSEVKYELRWEANMQCIQRYHNLD